jgi:hypothetical protein
MKIKLTYEISRDDNNKIESRDAYYTFTGNPEEVEKQIDLFEDILRKHNFNPSWCPVREMISDKLEYTDSVNLNSKQEFEMMKAIYKEFKKNLK